MTKEDVLKKAKAILEKKGKEDEHNNICVKAGICPDCGEKLEIQRHEDFPDNYYCDKCGEEYWKKKYFFFGPLERKRKIKYFDKRE